MVIAIDWSKGPFFWWGRERFWGFGGLTRGDAPVSARCVAIYEKRATDSSIWFKIAPYFFKLTSVCPETEDFGRSCPGIALGVSRPRSNGGVRHGDRDWLFGKWGRDRIVPAGTAPNTATGRTVSSEVLSTGSLPRLKREIDICPP